MCTLEYKKKTFKAFTNILKYLYIAHLHAGVRSIVHTTITLLCWKVKRNCTMNAAQHWYANEVGTGNCYFGSIYIQSWFIKKNLLLFSVHPRIDFCHTFCPW